MLKIKRGYSMKNIVIAENSRGILNRNQIKYIVIAAMLIDHLAWQFVDSQNIILGGFMHVIGRLTAPTMAYFAAEGYLYTRNASKYQLRLILFTLISWPPYVFFEFGYFPFCGQQAGIVQSLMQSVLFTLFLGVTAIRIWESIKIKRPVKVFLIVLLCIISLIGDWMFMNVLGVLFLYVIRENPKKKWIAFTAVYLIPNAIMVTISALMGGSSGLAGSWFLLGVILVPPLLYFAYNGKSGSKATIHKWLFYVFYPLHLLILGLLA